MHRQQLRNDPSSIDFTLSCNRSKQSVLALSDIEWARNPSFGPFVRSFGLLGLFQCCQRECSEFRGFSQQLRWQVLCHNCDQFSVRPLSFTKRLINIATITYEFGLLRDQLFLVIIIVTFVIKPSYIYRGSPLTGLWVYHSILGWVVILVTLLIISFALTLCTIFCWPKVPELNSRFVALTWKPFQYCVIIVIQFCEKRLHYIISLINGPHKNTFNRSKLRHRGFLFASTPLRPSGVPFNQINSFDKWASINDGIVEAYRPRI